MKQFTQDTFHPRGNCWQFAVACILEVDPHELPAQFDHYSQNDPDAGGESLWSLNYNNALNAYLRKHHGQTYVEVYGPDALLECLMPLGVHLITGRTVRSDAQNGCRHVVVGRNGKMVWDPHPSRAGLLDDGTGNIRWAFLVPFPAEWDPTWRDVPCVCPACTEAP